MEKFLILAGRRSGTTFLASSLDSHAQIECTKEIFSTKRRFRYFQVDKSGSSFYKFRSTTFNRQFDYIFRRQQLITSFLTEIFAPCDTIKAKGIRLSYEQAHKYPEVLRWALKNNVRVIHLIRENSLKAIVSHFTAQKRGVHHVTSNVERVTVRVSPAKLKKLLIKRNNDTEKYRQMFNERQYCEVCYETFVKNREAESRRIFDFLQIDQFMALTSNLVKQNPDSLKDILDNYEEVSRAFKGTTFEKYL
jgi:LPS sulfotransferase NodH